MRRLTAVRSRVRSEVAMWFKSLFAALALSACIQDRCELARDRAIVCGRDFDDVCDEDLTQRQRCAHRCIMREPCWDVELCILGECRWPAH